MSKRNFFLTEFLLGCLIITGCIDKAQKDITIETNENTTEQQSIETSILEEEISDYCLHIYEEAYSTDDDSNAVRKIVDELGNKGFVAVDYDNRINMTCSEQMEDFIEIKNRGENGEIKVFCITNDSSFWIYKFSANDNKVYIKQQYYNYLNHEFEISDISEYEAGVFEYTDEGYLMIEGSWYSAEKYVMSLCPEEWHIALRVKPLDEKCKELNYRYIIPISYSLNNAFITNWEIGDYGNLDFYDIFCLFYEEIYQTEFPYQMSEDLSTGEEYMVSKEEFEKVIMLHFPVTCYELQETLRYDTSTECYIYRPRGFNEFDYAEIPYPEVVAYEENGDGSLTLTVNAVYPNANTSKLFSHKVTVSEKDGSVQYLSNQIVDGEALNLMWHADRYTDEEWEEYYGGDNIKWEDENWMLPKVEKELITDIEKKQIEDNVLDIVSSVWYLYSDVTLEEGPSYASNIKEFSRKQRTEVVEALGDEGVVAVTEGTNMQNGGILSEFCEAYRNNDEGMVTVYEVYKDGLISAITFIYRDNQLQTYYVGVKPDEKGYPYLIGKSVQDIDFINLTEKGYFIYSYKNIPIHASLCQYWRVSPISDECREMTERYVSNIDFQRYNLLIVDWDINTVSDVLMPGLFEDFYYITYGEPYRESNESIPVELFESIMMKYLPVSIEQLRDSYTYDDVNNTYCDESVYGSPYPPFGEVVDYVYNDNGTVTLYVDVVWPDKNSDYAFTNVIVVQPFDDGSFRFLSNHVEEKELELPPIANFRNLNVYFFFTCGDLLDAPKWDARMEKNQKKGTQHDFGHFNIALELARYITE